MVWFTFGIFLIPVLALDGKYMTAETSASWLGLCRMVVLADYGFSRAGGFIMAPSCVRHRGRRHPPRHHAHQDLFRAVFFVSVGMMVDPAVLVKYTFPSDYRFQRDALQAAGRHYGYSHQRQPLKPACRAFSASADRRVSFISPAWVSVFTS